MESRKENKKDLDLDQLEKISGGSDPAENEDQQYHVKDNPGGSSGNSGHDGPWT